jgi:hypothetical protein
MTALVRDARPSQPCFLTQKPDTAHEPLEN